MGLAAYRAGTCGAPQAASEVDPWQDGSEKKIGRCHGDSELEKSQKQFLI
jgi:hypothetical protein